MDDPPKTSSLPQRKISLLRISLSWQQLFEGSLVFIALSLGWAFNIAPLETLHWSWMHLGLGVLATIPPLILLGAWPLSSLAAISTDYLALGARSYCRFSENLWADGNRRDRDSGRLGEGNALSPHRSRIGTGPRDRLAFRIRLSALIFAAIIFGLLHK